MTPLLAVVLWVLAATATAVLPMRWQIGPGLLLLLAAPALMVWIGRAHGWPWAVLFALAFASMFRRPLGALLRRLLRRNRAP